jgi:cytochrome c2
VGTIASAWWLLALVVGEGGEGKGDEAHLRAADPRPGWALTCAGAKEGDAPVTTLREWAAFTLAPGETLDPEIEAAGLHATWAADLEVARAGRYRFTIESCGGAVFLNVVGQRGEKLPHQDSSGESVTTGEWLDLEAGSVRLLVNFRRRGDEPARLRLLWEMELEDLSGFGPEPIPPSAVTVAPELREAVEGGLSAERGRVLLVELGCVNCHAASGGAAAALERRPPIALERVGARARRDWLARWIEDPQKLNPGCAMPSVLAGADAKRDVAALVDLFESAVASPPPAEISVDPLLADRGRALFHEVGCIACHGALASPQAVFAGPEFQNALPKVEPAVPFGDLAGKWRVDELAKFLLDPKAVRTHGRMPDFGLTEPEAKAIAHYLASCFTASNRAAERAASAVADSAPATIAPERLEAGKKVFSERGCAACHTLGEGLGFQVPEKTKALAALDPARGCLADADAPAHGHAPCYTVTASQRGDLRAALASLSRLVAAPAPGESSRRVVEAFHCLSCHEKDERGGVAIELAPYFRTLSEADLGDEGRLPPRLTGVGGRLRSDWIEEVVANGTRARPYLVARMPKFGAGVAKSVANGVAALEGVWRSDAQPGRACEPKVDPSLAAAGRFIVGKEGLNCVTCHSFGDRPSAGTPGLDFQAMAKRIRFDFWRRYALAPLRFKPGTRMPVYFVNGKSEADILDNAAMRQIDAIWSWFEHEKEMPAPDGVPSGKGLVLDVGDRSKVFRTFLERAGNRGIAVGTPQGLHFAFDAEQIRLVEAWTGEFLNVAPVWEGRGGHVAPELGPVVWSAPPGPALLLAPPDVLKGGKIDPNVASTLTAWPIDSGRNHGLRFRGYLIWEDGLPSFLYELGEHVRVEEHDRPVGADGIRFMRDFIVRGLDLTQVVMMREPADAVSGVDVRNGVELAEETRVKGDASNPPPPRTLFFRSDGTDFVMFLSYGVRQ